MTAPHYGKRNLGLGTAASPGDTLYFFYGAYNDSGNSEADTGFSVTDIEVYKDNGTTPRLTDSGYSLILDTGTPGLRRFRIQLFNTADDASFYANGSWYQVAVDNVKIDGKLVRFWAGSFEIGEPRANVVQLGGDTGALNWLRQTFAAGFSDTGIQERLARIQSDVDTGLRVHIDDSDTGLKDTIADLDTGLRGILITTGVNLGRIRGDTGGADRFFRYTQKLDTGGDATVSASVDTGQVNQAVWGANAQRKLTVDTGIADQVWKQPTSAYNDDTGTFGELLRNPSTATVDTGQVNQAVWQGNATRALTAGVNVEQIDGDTGYATQLGKFASVLSASGMIDTGTGAADTGHVVGAVWAYGGRKVAVDTGIADQVWKQPTASYADDTGTFGELLRVASAGSATVDTGQINQAVWQANAIRGITAISDTGLNDNLSRIRFDVDTGLRAQISDVDTGLHDTMADYDSGMRVIVNAIKAKTDSLTFTVAGMADANIRYVNSVQITGAGDTGTGNMWRPA